MTVVIPQNIDIEKVEANINGALFTYNKMAIQLRTLLIVLGLLGTALSLFVSTFISDFDEIVIKSISYISSLSLAVISYFNIGAKGNSSRNAWRHLQNANSSYRAGGITILQLVQAYKESEEMLGETNFTYQIPTR